MPPPYPHPYPQCPQGRSCRCGREVRHPTARECRLCHVYRMRVSRGADPIDAALVAPPGALCEICDAAPVVFDHDHLTGRFRGWVCNPCNMRLAGDMVTAWPGALRARVADYLAKVPAPR